MDKVSVIIPVYNVETYVERCIDSIINQTYQELEILIINDGSKDSSGVICDKKAQQDGRIRVIHQKNQGVSVARNRGIEESTGKWLCFVDGDDYAEKDMVQMLVENADEETDLIISDFYVASTKHRKYSQFVPGKTDAFFSKTELFEHSMIKSDSQQVTCIGTPWAKLYHTNLIRKNNLSFQVGLKRNQDMIFNLYAFEKANSVRYLPVALYNYVVWENSAVHKYTPDFSVVSSNVLKAMRQFETTLEKPEEHIFFEDLINGRTMNMFHETLKLQFFHKDRNVAFRQNYKAFVTFCLESGYLQLLESKEVVLSKPQKIMVWLMAHKLYGVTYFYYQVMFALMRK